MMAGGGLAQEPVRSTCVPHGKVSGVFQPPPRLVYATLDGPGDEPRVATIYLGTLLQEIAQTFAAPDSTAPPLAYSFTLNLHRDGRLTDAEPVEEYIPPPLAAATMRAIDSVSRRGGIGPVSFEMADDPLPLTMLFQQGESKTDTSIPFYRLTYPAYFEYETDKPALSVPGNPFPSYPSTLRALRIEGEVLAQFMVDTMGRPDMSTVRILDPQHTYREFAESVIETLPKMRFTPAERRGCKVKQLVQLPFAFELR